MSDLDSLSESESVSGTLSLSEPMSESDEDDAEDESESAGSALERSDMGSEDEPLVHSSAAGLMSFGSVFIIRLPPVCRGAGSRVFVS